VDYSSNFSLACMGDSLICILRQGSSLVGSRQVIKLFVVATLCSRDYTKH